jgi:hypothetical protein
VSAVPFSWQDKRILRLIRERTEDHTSTLAAYMALTEAASNNASDEFTSSQAALAAMSGLSVRTLGKRLRDLQGIGVVSIHSPALDVPATFKLLPVPGAPSLGNGCRALGNDCRALGNPERSPLPTLEEQKNRRKETPRRPLTPSERISAEKGLEAARKTLMQLERATLREKQSDDYKPRLEHARQTVAKLTEDLAR